MSDVLQTLDEHYSVVITFDILSKELYSLKQGSRENVAELGIHLLQQVQILQLEYPGRIQPEHVGEISVITSMRAFTPNTSKCWPTKWMVNTHWLLQPTPISLEVGKRGRSQESSTPKTTQLAD